MNGSGHIRSTKTKVKQYYFRILQRHMKSFCILANLKKMKLDIFGLIQMTQNLNKGFLHKLMTLCLMCAPSADRINQDSCSHKQMRLTTLLINRLVFMFKRPDVWHAPMNKIILTYQVSHNGIFVQVFYFRSIDSKSLYSFFCQIFRLFLIGY